MPRRVSLPSADDLFRPTASPETDTTREGAGTAAGSKGEPEKEPVKPRTSGRVRHDEKMTVYITSEELLALEQARLQLRSAHGVGIDRGRLVREAVSLVLADLEERGADSALVRRLVEE